PLLSLIPYIFECSANFLTVLGSIETPVFDGILYRKTGIDVAYAISSKYFCNSTCEGEIKYGVITDNASAPNFSNSLASLIDSMVLLLPAPSITGTRPSTSSMTIFATVNFSSKDRA